MNKNTVIGASDLANDLDDAEVESLAEIAFEERYSRDDIIIKEDETNRDIFIIYEGWVYIEAQRSVARQESVKLDVLRSKGVIGELSFIDGSRRTANAVAKDNVLCLRLPHKNLHALMEKTPRIGYIIMRNLAIIISDRMRALNFELRNHMLR
ncbi:hypothetical protein MNBD_NITROSPINAE02-2202 [hydrothermal vent metagenome]|uniref:Cyclic nucleotide-binding domain-containing protein n=1 Tax=hydrothermal vent metagenome TaxID=652676 RepID=A0A3B1BQR1_9ZZZZ